jgi:Bcr/CflA subfamily drug resistance transporter
MKKNTTLKISIGLLIALIGFPQISETIYTPALPAVALDLKTSAHKAEATLAIYFIGFALGVLLWGAFSDFFGRRKTMLLGIVIYALGTIGCLSTNSIEGLLLWRLLQAFGASVGSVITQTMLRDVYDGVQRARLFSIIGAALAFSPALGPVIGGFVSESYGWRANFWFLACMSAILYVWSFLCLPETKPEQIAKKDSKQMLSLLKSMISSKLIWGHVILISATNGILFGFYEEAPFVFIQNLGVRSSVYGFVGLLIAGATILAARFTYRFANKYSSEKVIEWGARLSILGSLIYLTMEALGLFYVGHAGFLVGLIGLFVVFFGIGLIIPNSLSQALKPYQDVVGTAGSIFGGLYYILIAGFTWIMSLLHNSSSMTLPLFIASLGIILMIGSRLVIKSEPSIEQV